MRLLIDLQGAQASNRTRGIGRYSLALAQAIARQAGNHEIWLALNNCFPDSIDELRASFDGLMPPEHIVVWDAPVPVAAIDPANHWRKKVAERLREEFFVSIKPDIVHVSSLFEGLGDNAITSINGRLSTAVTLYDLIPLVNRQHYLKNPLFESWYENKLGHMRRAQLWLAISESSRQEGIDWLNLPEDQVINISAGADAWFRPLSLSVDEVEKIRHRYGLSRPFVMYTGGIDLRKNIEGLIASYAKLNKNLRSSHQLAIVCTADEAQINALRQQVLQCGLTHDDVVFTGFVSDTDMAILYNLCAAFIFPSWHEGFGLPALEAMYCGAAVVAANTSSLPEVIGRADALFNPYDQNDITAKLQRVLTDDAFRSELQQHGLKQAAKFSWDNSARRALAGFEQLHARNTETRNIRITVPTNYRPSLAYVSPLPPEKSGISDYSAELLRELTRHYEIDVVVAQTEISDPWIAANCTMRSIAWFDQNAHRFDRILYHFGNSSFHQHMFGLLERHPGTVVLHDFFLSGVLSHMSIHGNAPNAWITALYNSHGYSAVQERFSVTDSADAVWKYPCNFDVLKQANGVIVHSQFSKQMGNKWYDTDIGVDWAQIPHLRVPLVTKDRAAARASLGLKENDFLVCSFGILGPHKLNHLLLSAWFSSPLAQDSSCYLVFVGENDGSHYGAMLLRTIERHDASERIKITGFASSTLYRTYLAAADAAVQLRTLSRGETSGTVLDCMNYGLATIINAHGAMNEISSEVALVIPDQCTDVDLSMALQKIWRDPVCRQKIGELARLQIHTLHHPWSIGNQYQAVIERFAESGPQVNKMNLMRGLSELDSVPLNESEWAQVAKAIALNHPDQNPSKQLLIDISELVQRDAKSGIQRVVRSVLKELLSTSQEGFRVEPIYAGSDGIYRYARRFTLNFLGCSVAGLNDEPIESGPGDIFLGLDLCPQLAPLCRDALTAMKHRGTAVFFVVYDLLCVNRPDCFVEGAFDGFTRWLQYVVKHADGAICISRAVADELATWLQNTQLKRQKQFKVGWFHLGADIENSVPSDGVLPEFNLILEQMHKRLSILMVGTIEPRKGYAQALSAFETLWNRGVEVNLVIVGKSGWMVEDLVSRLRAHELANKNLFWFESATDEILQQLYDNANGLLLASEAEGFGLPLIEAAKHNVPILTRDIPVFREVAGEHATYFESMEVDALADALNNWLLRIKNCDVPAVDGIQWLKWTKSAEILVALTRKDAHPQWVHGWAAT